MIHVLYISYDGMTDPLGQSQVIPYLQGLTQFGYRFTLLSCEKKERYGTHRQLISDLLKDYPITWESVFYTKKPPVFSTVFDCWKLKRKLRSLQKRDPFQMVHCRSYIPALLGLFCKKQFNTAFLFDMRGFWADERVDGGLWKLSHPIYRTIYRFFKQKEKLFIQHADAIISLTEKGRQEMLTWPVMQQRKDVITVIPCCVDTSLFNPDSITEDSRREAKKQLGIDESSFVLSYLGSIGTWYMLDEMLDFFVVLQKKIPSAKFLFITYDEHSKIRNSAEKKGIDKDSIIIQPAPRGKVPFLLSVSNWSIFFIKPAYSKMSSSPTKQGEIMSMGIPVVCNDQVGDTSQIVHTYQSGIVVKAADYRSAVGMVQATHADNAMKQHIRAGALDYFSLRKGVEQYAAVYHSLSHTQS